MVCDYGQPAPFCFYFTRGLESYYNFPAQEAPEPSASNHLTCPFLPHPHEIPYASTMISPGDEIPFDLFARQNTVPFSPLPYSDPPTPEYEANGTFAALEPSLPVAASQSTLVVANNPGARIHAGPSVSNPPGTVREEETAALSVVPPSVVNAGFRNPKKRRAKKLEAKPKPRLIPYRETQHPGPRTPTHVCIVQFAPTQEMTHYGDCSRSSLLLSCLRALISA